ncbi:hypothetical protein ACIGNX_22085 [Actinosynnema sp. NPDC053489]|uniref:hypothetical protein n=1 Tax=Actinosynnema sp. NPDC053489 TaxID=3363916 RepID=UPI0037CA71CE
MAVELGGQQHGAIVFSVPGLLRITADEQALDSLAVVRRLLETLMVARCGDCPAVRPDDRPDHRPGALSRGQVSARISSDAAGRCRTRPPGRR